MRYYFLLPTFLDDSLPVVYRFHTPFLTASDRVEYVRILVLEKVSTGSKKS